MIDFKQISIVGFGLIGASLAKAFREYGFVGPLHAVDRDHKTLDAALALGLIDAVGVEGSDLVILAIPVGRYDAFFDEWADALAPDCLITDAGSVKSQAHRIVERRLRDRQRFVGGHPMVGSEQSGYLHSKAHLFENAYYFLTDRSGQAEDVERLKSLFSLIGARSIEVTPDSHDRIVARTSHLPHINAALLVNILNEGHTGLIEYAGGGFRDTTRIASSNPSLWTDILLNNQQEVIQSIEAFQAALEAVKNALTRKDPDWLQSQLTLANRYREQIPNHLQDAISRGQSVYIDVKDRPGVIASAAGLLADHEISIRDIEIMHAREQMPGVLKIGFYSEEDRFRAFDVLGDSDFGKHCTVHLGGE